MDDLISKSAVIELLHYNCDESCSSIVRDVENLSAVDAEPVVHGYWVREPTETFGSTDYDYHCSACKSYPVKDVLTKRCPNCGAKMDEVSE